MDITNYQVSDAPKSLVIVHPETGENTDIIIECISPDHPDYQQRAIDTMRASVKNGNKTVDAIAADVTKNKAIHIGQAIVGWKNITEKGKDYKYSPANAVKLCQKYPWIADQIDAFCGQRRNFFSKASAD